MVEDKRKNQLTIITINTQCALTESTCFISVALNTRVSHTAPASQKREHDG